MKVRHIFLLIGLFAILIGGCDSAADREVEADIPMAVETGKVAQVYVSNATIIADKIGSEGVGNFDLDLTEVHTFTDNEGNFSLDIPETYRLDDYLLYSKGGTVRDSQGNLIPAFPMLAPKGARNITPMTTLAVLSPALKAKIGEDYDADIAGPEGVRWEIMQLAKSAETVLGVLANKNAPVVTKIAAQFAVLKKLAAAYANPEVDVTDDVQIAEATDDAVYIALTDYTVVSDADMLRNADGITSAVVTGVETVLNAIPNEGVIAEADILPDAEQALGVAVSMLGNYNMLAFDPTTSVIPFPNDLTWATLPEPRTGLVTIDPATASSDAGAALYMAVNSLELRGFSPNAPIAIPLMKNVPLDPESLQENVRIVNLRNLVGTLYVAMGLGANPLEASAESVIAALSQLDENAWAGVQAGLEPYLDNIYDADMKAVQDENYIKVFPLKSLDADCPYLVVILDNIYDTNGFLLREPTYYKFLKSENELTAGASAALEPIRKSYEPVYNYYLRTLGIGKDDTLEIFTFATADKTLSLGDFAQIGAYLAGAGDMSGITGLNYSGITGEYSAIDAGTDQLLALMESGTLPVPFVNPDSTFMSFDIATLQITPPDMLRVPYVVYNGETYSDTVVIFQHGLGRVKTDAVGLPDMGLPVLAMDFPLHGDRAAGDNDGAGYFTGDIARSRVNIYQSLFDMTMMLKNLRSGKFDINADGEADTPENVYFVGISLGSIVGSMFSSFNSEMLDKIVLNVGGGGFAALLDGAMNAEIADVSASMGLERNTTPYFVSLGMMQTLFDPADPMNLVRSDFKDKVIIQTAHKDTFVPNMCNEIQANAIGHPESVNLPTFDAPASPYPGWYHFGGQPDKADNWIKHGFLMDPSLGGYPEIPEGVLDPIYLEDANQLAREQLVNFFK